MLETIKNGQPFTYEKLSQEEMQSRGILGRLVGIIADLKGPTRNGRKYKEELWDKVFNDPIMEEKLQTRTLLGELEHPADGRSQVDPREACICLAEKPKKKDGKLYGVFDILPTENGKILKALCDYGTVIGVSSRGEGDIIEGFDGTDEVDPETYECFCWDAVLLPAVKEARMQLVMESVDSRKSLKSVLAETIEKADDMDKAKMQETVDRLFDRPVLEHVELVEDTDADTNGDEEISADESLDLSNEDDFEIFDELVHKLYVSMSKIVRDTRSSSMTDLDEEDITKAAEYAIMRLFDNVDEGLNENECNNQDDCADKSVENEKEPEEVADGKSVLLSDLQEALRVQKELKAGTKELGNKLAVSDAKVNELIEELNKYKDLTIKLSESAKNSKKLVKESEETISSLKESLAKAQADTKVEAKNLTESISKKSEEVENVTKKLQKSVNINKALNESVKSLQENLKSLNEKLDEASREISTLKEELEDEKQNSAIKANEFNSKVQKAINIAESYKKAANLTMDHYIESKAKMLGVSKNEIKNRLGKTYTANDVDSVCESLREYRLNLSKLPFNVEGVKVKFTESKNDNLRIENLADEIDDQLLEMVKNL